MVDSWYCLEQVVPEGISQVSRRSEVGNTKRRSLNTLLSSGTSAGTFTVSAGPYINYHAKASTKNEPWHVFDTISKKGLENRSSRFEPKNSWLSCSRGSGPPLRSNSARGDMIPWNDFSSILNKIQKKIIEKKIVPAVCHWEVVQSCCLFTDRDVSFVLFLFFLSTCLCVCLQVQGPLREGVPSGRDNVPAFLKWSVDDTNIINASEKTIKFGLISLTTNSEDQIVNDKSNTKNLSVCFQTWTNTIVFSWRIIQYITTLSKAFYRWCHRLIAFLCSHWLPSTMMGHDGSWLGLFWVPERPY